MKRETRQFVERVYGARQRTQVVRERIRADNRVAVTRIRANADMYCADVDERIGRDMADTVQYAADAERHVAMARMAGDVIRSRGDVLVQASRERCEQIRALTLQAHAARKALAAGVHSSSRKAELENELRTIGRLQRDIMSEAREHTRRHALQSGSLLALPETEGCRI